MLKILSWNIRQGGGTRLQKIVDSLAEINPEVIVLSEYRNNNKGNSLRNKALNLGYRFQAVTNANKDENSVIILSKIPGDVEIYNDIDLDYKSNIITVHFGAFSVIGVYLPHKKKHQLIPFITEIIDSSDKNYIVAGDYNTGINYVDQKGNSFWYEDALKNMETVGMKDAFRHINGSVLEYSWYSHQENGYRYDHTYVAEALLPIVKNCYYLHEYREDGLSDHSPMLLELG